MGSGNPVWTFLALCCIAADTQIFFCRINPYWKLALIFKCLTDNIMLDDFKTELEKLRVLNLDRVTDQIPNTIPPIDADKSKDDQVEVENAFTVPQRLEPPRNS